MATQINVHDLENVKTDLETLAREMPNVAVRAINKALTGTKTDVKSIIRAEYNIKAGALDTRMTANKATKANISGSLVSRGGPTHLTDIAGTNKTARGISVNVRKSTGRQLLPRAFKAAGRNSGKEIVLRRPGKPRGQHANLWGRYGPPGSGGKVGSQARLDTFYGPHPEILMNAPENWAKIQTAAAQRLDTNIEREIDAEFRRLEGKW